MASNFSALTLAFLFFFHFASLHFSAAAEPYVVNVVIEEGYTVTSAGSRASLRISPKAPKIIEPALTVTTVIDGHKIGISPYAVILKPGSSDLVVLDYSGSALYTVPFPVSKETVIKRFSGTGEVGYVDGEPGSVQFNKPRSFAVDLKGNVYVADKNNNVIRKINTSGVTTTIAGVNKKTGQVDGPVQNATFSNDFSNANFSLVCSLLERLFLPSLSHLSLLFRTVFLIPQTRALRKEQATLLESDKVCSNRSSSSSETAMMSIKYANQLKDLISFDESLDLTNPTGTKMAEEGEEYQPRGEVVLSNRCGNGKVDKMIKTNIMHFADLAKETTLIDGRSGLVKRR